MLSDLVNYWSTSTLSQKIQLLKRILIETIIILTMAFLFFWSTFIFSWLVSLLIGVEPYFQVSAPNFHVRALKPDSLVSIYVNGNWGMKEEACRLGPEHVFFSELTVPFHEYCNIQQEALPKMSAPVDISITEVDTNRIAFVSGCIKHKAKQISCQKYPSAYTLLLFRNVEFYNLYYLQIELHLKKSIQMQGIGLSYSPKIQFEEKCWLITRLVKKYYSVIMFGFSYGVTALLMVVVIVYRVWKIVKKSYEENGKVRQEPSVKRNIMKVSSSLNESLKSRANPSQPVVVPQNQKKVLIRQEKEVKQKSQQDISMVKKTS